MKKAVVFLFLITLCFSLWGGRAYASDYTLTVVTREGEYVYSYPDLIVKNGENYLRDKENKIKKIVSNSYKSPQNAKMKLNEKGEIEITSDKKGEKINERGLEEIINYALKNSKKRVEAVYVDVYAEISEDYLKRCVFLRGVFSTDYSNSSSERKHNIELAVKKINGKTLMSNEEFSFNLTVGQRNEANGFKNSKVIENGAFVEGVGGGVCQVSTTLYNAVLLSGLKISEYHAHSLSVSYVEKSFDAMVSYGWADLKFINDTNGYCLLKATADGEKVKIEVYGVKNELRYERESIITEEISYSITEEESEELYSDESVIKTKGKAGYKSEGYLKIYSGGEEKKILIRKDEYKKVDEVIIKGIKEKRVNGENGLQKTRFPF